MGFSDSIGLQGEEEHILTEHDGEEDLELKARRFHFYNAKAFLLTSSSVINDSVYEHMVKFIKCILKNGEESRLNDTEQLSRFIKRRLHDFLGEQVNTVDDLSPERRIAFLHKDKYQQPIKKSAVASDTESSAIAIPDITGILNAFMHAGIGNTPFDQSSSVRFLHD
ncbi:unnamed protein product [Dicrocoelium dendriticum]|nr:unnamed protein product [Dicrocoelium dendriticum]